MVFLRCSSWEIDFNPSWLQLNMFIRCHASYLTDPNWFPWMIKDLYEFCIENLCFLPSPSSCLSCNLDETCWELIMEFLYWFYSMFYLLNHNQSVNPSLLWMYLYFLGFPQLNMETKQGLIKPLIKILGAACLNLVPNI